MLFRSTHGFLDAAVYKHFADCDELWHAGDFGRDVAEPLEAFKPLKGVYGNIDGNTIRQQFPEAQLFTCEEVKIFITHIGGYPDHYERGVKQILQQQQPDLYICGHSHLLKIIRDPVLNNLLHINPGAAGRSGFHQIRTLVRLKIEGKKIFGVEVIELGKRSSG